MQKFISVQVWLGALLLCDFMLHYNALFAGKVVVDLGAGVGLTSIVAALQANTVFCTGKSVVLFVRYLGE